MRLLDLLRTVAELFEHRARSFLTLLGIVIGSGSIVFLAALLAGGEQALMRTNQRANEADLVQVKKEQIPMRDRGRTRRELSRVDAAVLRESRALDGARVASESSHDTRADFGERHKRVTVVSAAPDALGLYRLSVGQGRFLTAADQARGNRVCVVGYEVWQELLLGKNLDSGLILHVDDHAYTVIGALADKPLLGSTDGTWIWNRKIIVPESTFDAVYEPAHTTERIYVRKAGAESAGLFPIRRIISETLLRRHFGVKNFKLDDRTNHAEERLILMVVKLLLLSTGLVALIVGGINIMNIMLVSVTERTREIGIRRALGATRNSILLQFLLESATLATIGGLIGVVSGLALSAGAALLLDRLLGDWSFQVEAWPMLLALGSALITGAVFGVVPAFRAARIEPIEALRFE